MIMTFLLKVSKKNHTFFQKYDIQWLIRTRRAKTEVTDKMERVRYNPLIPGRIYIGSERDAQDMADFAGCDFILDLREETAQPAFSSDHSQWIHIGLNDHITGQEALIQKAIQTVVHLYHQGKTVGIHCEAGRCRTAAVAIGVLLELGICRKLKEALEYVEITRKQTDLHPCIKQSLANLFH
jgi:rhodanese-related sulfurtransferase